MGLAIVHLERRRLVWTNVTTNPTSEWIARQITEAFPWDQAPSYLIRDRDSSYGGIVRKRIRAMGIRDRPTASSLTLAEWIHRTAHRLNPARMPGPCPRPGRGASAPDPQSLRRLLQLRSHSSGSGQGRPSKSPRPVHWTSRNYSSAGRPASQIWPDGLIGRDTSMRAQSIPSPLPRPSAKGVVDRPQNSTGQPPAPLCQPCLTHRLLCRFSFFDPTGLASEGALE